MSKKVQANAIAKAIATLDSLGFMSSEDISNVRNSLRDIMISRGYTMCQAGSSRTRAITMKDSVMWKDFQSALAIENGTEMERKQVITYRWWNAGHTEIKGSHFAELEENATERIKQMVGEGYYSGELHAVCYDQDVVIEYTGWWEVK